MLYEMVVSFYSGRVRGSPDNPTYDKGIIVAPIAIRTTGVDDDVDDERLFQNPLYSDVSDMNSQKNTNTHHTVSSKKTLTYENTQVSGVLMKDKADDSCYSTLGLTEYATIQPHIPKATQQQSPPDDDEYSQLCLLYTSPSPRDATLSRMPSSA